METESRVAAIDEYLAADATVSLNGNTFSVQKYRDRLRTQDRRLDVTDAEIQSRVADGNTVAVTVALTYKHTGTTYGVKPSDTTIESQVSAIHEFEDGEIVDLEIVYDGSQTLRDLGLLSENPITEKLRDQYYEVLNRVLRHDLRNDMNVIRSEADLLRRKPNADRDAIADEVDNTIDGLLNTVEKAQQLERLAIDAPLTVDAVDVTEVAETIVSRYQYRDSVSCHCDHRPIAVATDRRLLENLLGEVVENATEHNPTPNPNVNLTVQSATGGRYAVEIIVSDNGPGISESELRPIRQDEETKLLHGSGIGLWILKWCVTRLEGQVTFDTDDGTTVVIRLPDLN